MKDYKRELNIDELGGITGGSGAPAFDAKRMEFEAAWTKLNMDASGCSVNRKAAIYKEWELNDFQPGAEAFLRMLSGGRS